MDDSSRALIDAQYSVRRVKSRNQEVSELASSLREIRTRNHFSEQIMEIMTRPYGGE